MNYELNGKVALVTGGARDVGGDIVKMLAGEGAIVAINYHSSANEAEALAKEVEAAGGQARAYQADISDYAQVTEMIDNIVRDFGRVDVLVNNAGYVKFQKFVETKDEDWKKQIDTCLYGALHCCHAVAPVMIEQNGGRIINLVGDSSRIGEANLSIAAAARGGTIALGKSLAKELGRNNVTVNSISLGLIQTSHSDTEFLEQNMSKIVKAYPLKRIGQPGDIAPMVTFLASDQAAWVTGQVVSVNGGFCMV